MRQSPSPAKFRLIEEKINSNYENRNGILTQIFKFVKEFSSQREQQGMIEQDQWDLKERFQDYLLKKEDLEYKLQIVNQIIVQNYKNQKSKLNLE